MPREENRQLQKRPPTPSELVDLWMRLGQPDPTKLFTHYLTPVQADGTTILLPPPNLSASSPLTLAKILTKQLPSSNYLFLTPISSPHNLHVTKSGTGTLVTAGTWNNPEGVWFNEPYQFAKLNIFINKAAEELAKPPTQHTSKTLQTFNRWIVKNSA